MYQNIEVGVQYGGEVYPVKARVIELPVPDGSVITHFEIDGAGTHKGVVFELGRRLVRDSLQRATEEGRIAREKAEELMAIAEARAGLPRRGRRLIRQPLFPKLRGPDPTQLSQEADIKAAARGEQFLRLCFGHSAGRNPDWNDMPAGKLLRWCLEVECVVLLRETDHLWLLTTDERVRRIKAQEVLLDEGASSAEKETAGKVLQESERNLDDRYRQYYTLRKELMTGGLSDEQLLRRVDNLRKSKTHPEHKNMARLLKTDNEDMCDYRPYFGAMDLVRQELVRHGYLGDYPSLSFYVFLHRPHEFLSGIVPALHPLYHLFLQSLSFRAAVAQYASENLNGKGAKSPRTVCNLYGAILAIVETYAEAVHVQRAKDSDRSGKVQHRRGSDLIAESSFDESWGTAVPGQNGPHRPLGGTEEDRKRAERNMLKDFNQSPPAIDIDTLRQHFNEGAAKKIDVCLRRNKESVQQLAEEYGCDRITIWRWCKEAKKLLRQKGREAGINLDTGEI